MSDTLSIDSLNGLEIIVIDDDEDSLDVASIVLEFAGANITLASNGKEGIESVRNVNPQLVLCDISMPIMDGWEFIRQIRIDQEYKDLNVIALTAHAMVGDREKVLEAGFNGYLTKPLDPTKFVTQLLATLETAGIQHPLLTSLTRNK